MSNEIALNRKAHRDYEIIDTYEAGLALKGTEVKSLRQGKGNISDSFARIEKGEAWLYNCDIQPYAMGNRANHEPKAIRKLLLHRQELEKLFGIISIRGRALVPLKMYWKNNKIKVLLGIGVGKNVRDKRQDLKKKAVDKEIKQAMKNVRKRG